MAEAYHYLMAMAVQMHMAGINPYTTEAAATPAMLLGVHPCGGLSLRDVQVTRPSTHSARQLRSGLGPTASAIPRTSVGVAAGSTPPFSSPVALLHREGAIRYGARHQVASSEVMPPLAVSQA